MLLLLFIIIIIIDDDYLLLLMIVIDNYYHDKINFISIIIEVIRLVLNFLFFFTIRFHKYKKAFFY